MGYVWFITIVAIVIVIWRLHHADKENRRNRGKE